jgi:hypothetical protein
MMVQRHVASPPLRFIRPERMTSLKPAPLPIVHFCTMIWTTILQLGAAPHHQLVLTLYSSSS